MHLAAKAGKVYMMKTLVFGKADMDLLDGKSGKTALHHAVDNDDLPVATYLLTEVRRLLLYLMKRTSKAHD